METVAIILLLILLAFIGIFVARPFYGQRRVFHEGSHELSSLLAERERLLTALQDLDFDQSLGRISAEDYPTQRAALIQKGVAVLRQMDALTPSSARQASGKVKLADSALKPSASLSDDDLEVLPAKRRIVRKEKTGGFCSKCGRPILQSDVFCPSCGSTLT